jgi:hypothetical protein
MPLYQGLSYDVFSLRVCRDQRRHYTETAQALFATCILMSSGDPSSLKYVTRSFRLRAYSPFWKLAATVWIVQLQALLAPSFVVWNSRASREAVKVAKPMRFRQIQGIGESLPFATTALMRFVNSAPHHVPDPSGERCCGRSRGRWFSSRLQPLRQGQGGALPQICFLAVVEPTGCAH